MAKFLATLFVLILTTACMTPAQKNYDIIDRVNYEVNGIKYVSDKDNYGIENYPATPEEFYARGGDCEDYAIAKHQKLLKAGFTSGQIEYVSVVDSSYSPPLTHHLLKVGDKFLDNQSDNIQDVADIKQRYGNFNTFSTEFMEGIYANQRKSL